MINELNLLFAARRGYWGLDKDRKNNYMVGHPLLYLLFFLLILMIYPFLAPHLEFVLSSLFFLKKISYYSLFLLLLYLILPVGLTYENYYIVKTNTLETMTLFFNIKSKRLQFLVMLRNFIIISPLLGAGLYINCYYYLTMFILCHFFSLYLFIFYFKQFKRNYEIKVSTSLYILTIIDSFHFFNSLFSPCLYLILFFIMEKQGNLLYLKQDGIGVLLSFGILLGSFLSSRKSLSTLFLCLINDLDYLKAIKINVKSFLMSQIVFLTSLNLIVLLTCSCLLLFLLGMNIKSIIIICFAIIVTYIVLQSYQLKTALLFKNINLKTVQEFDNFPISIKDRVFLFAPRLVFILLFLLSQRIQSTYSSLVIAIILLSFILISIYNYRNYFSQIEI